MVFLDSWTVGLRRETWTETLIFGSWTDGLRRETWTDMLFFWGVGGMDFLQIGSLKGDSSKLGGGGFLRILEWD